MQVVWWSAFEKKYEAEVGAEADIFGAEAGEKRRADLRLRVTEHNILVVAKYYARIQLPRLAQLLDLSPAEVGDLLLTTLRGLKGAQLCGWSRGRHCCQRNGSLLLHVSMASVMGASRMKQVIACQPSHPGRHAAAGCCSRRDVWSAQTPCARCAGGEAPERHGRRRRAGGAHRPPRRHRQVCPAARARRCPRQTPAC